jgi:sugar transferase (PEP-CTERM/EpsH1 system associated)
MRKKVAVILSRFPFPLDKGDKLRAYHQIKYLSQDFDIYLFSLHTEKVSPNDLKELEPFCKEISLYHISYFDIFKGIIFSLMHHFPIQVGYFFSKRIKKEITNRINALQISTTYCQLSRTALYAEDLTCRKVLDFQDAFSTNYLRLSENTGGIQKMFYKREYKTMHAFEKKVIGSFDYCTIISAFDKSQIYDPSDSIVVVPNGVDTEYYSSTNKQENYDLLFVGNLSYLPNKNAVYFLVQNILPLLLKVNPNLTIRIVGADTPKEIFALANANVHVSGFVAEIREVYDTAKLFVAPLFTGAGLQNKILEAMSMQIPCITTSVVNKSLDGQDNIHLLIANNEQEFVSKIESLISSAALRVKLSSSAREFVAQSFSWETANKKLKEIL